MLPRKMRPCFSLISLLILAISLHASPAVAAGDHPPARPFRRNVAQQRRDILPSFSDPGSSPASTPASTPASSAPESATSTTPPPTSTPSTPASSNPPSVASTPTPPSSAAAAPSSPAAPGPSSPSPTLPPVVSTSTNAAGSVVFITETDPAPSAPSSSTTSAGGNNNNNNNSNSGTSTSTIVGLGVAGGVAVLGIVGFFVWKFTRKRFSDLDDNEAIKWPELNAHDGGTSLSAPLPTNRTGGAGFDSGAEISRPGSRAGYASSIGATSTTELYPAHADPYAVPPLPQFNPGQPYRDDPNAFYDPYSGPVPTAFGNNGSVEAIPMTQMAGRRSPGPGAVYGAPPPAAYSEYGAAVPPGPAYGGARTASPAPGAGGYGDRARSPGPGLASPVAGPGYGDRARSPGPGNAVAGGYGGYGQ